MIKVYNEEREENSNFYIVLLFKYKGEKQHF